MSGLKIVLLADGANPDAGDLYLNAVGTVELTRTLSEIVAQELWNRFHFFKGEWFLDPDEGIPYFQTLLGHKPGLDVVGQIFRSVILSVPGIKSLDAFTVKRVEGRGVSVEFKCTLDDGATIKSSDYAPFIIGSRG